MAQGQFDVAISSATARDVVILLKDLGTAESVGVAKLIEEEIAYAQRREQTTNYAN